MECGVIYKLVEPFQSFVFGSVKDYVGYIGSCNENLKKLRESLKILCNKKDDIRKRVKDGNDKLEEVTREAGHWLDDVQRLAMDKALKDLMFKDIEIGKFVVKLMEKSNLKWCLKNESEMQELVIKVMRKLKEEMEAREEDEVRRMIEVDYKNVGEVLVEVMKDTLDDFKKVIKEDKKMGVIAKRILVKEDLDKLTKDDPELEDIIRKVANASDEELRPNHDDEEPNAPLLQSPVVGVKEDSTLTDKAKELFKPLSSLLTPLKKLLSDAKFKKAVRGADGVKLGLEVIDVVLVKSPGLKRDMRNNAEQRHRSCCCCSSLSLCDYHGAYQISKAAASMAKRIQDEISKCPPDRVTSPISSADLRLLPSQFLKSLVSRTTLLRQILEYLKDDQVKMVGVFGMGGTGKTMMAKEVNNELKEIFNIKVMVEVSDTPDIMRIQAAIGESIGLPLHQVKTIGQRAVRIFNRLSTEKKALIMLDNIWKKLNLDEIGIPNTCKILLTTREKDVCRVMGVSDVNIVEVRLMNANEARELFKRHAGVQVDDGDFNQVVERLLSKCRGLPFSLVATATALKDKDLSSWEKFAKDLEKPISSQLVTGDYRHAYSILNTSYKFIESEEKKIFFLLACLSPPGSSVSTENLMRYGIGLNLFQQVDKLSEAMEQANTWVSELLSSSMLLEGDTEGYVKLHDIARSFGISFAAKEERHKFMVERIPRWLDNETLKMYSGISLMSGNDYSRLSGVEAYKLQILMLKGAMYIDDLFFKGMVNLEVLVLSCMNFELKLPESINKLEKLRTLCMERCLLGDIKEVGKLVNLLVLSLRESRVKDLPDVLGELSKLRLLDLNGCTFTMAPSIPPGVLGRLSNLEGLYLYNTTRAVPDLAKEINDDDVGKCVNENSTLPYLNAFEIEVSKMKELPIDGQSFQNLEKFRIFIGDEMTDSTELRGYGRVLYLHDNDAVVEECDKNDLDILLNKADKLSIRSETYVENLIHLVDKGGLRDLKVLEIMYISNEYIFTGSANEKLMAFPSLRVLSLWGMYDLKVICDKEAPLEWFSNLQTLTFHTVPEILYGLPFVPRNLEVINTYFCKSLKFIFLKDEPGIVELPFLKMLKLRRMYCLSSLVGPKNFSDTCDVSETNGIFFDGKIAFSSLESLDLYDCDSLVELWGKGVCHSGFQNLKNVCIDECDILSSIGSRSLFSDLEQLETFCVRGCGALREVIHSEETNESDISEQLIKFPRLKCLELIRLKILETFCAGGLAPEFPELKKLMLCFLPSMNNFLKTGNSEVLFHGKIQFPCLEELDVTNVGCEAMRLWDLSIEKESSVSNPAPMLRQLTLRASAGLPQIPSVILEKLSSLTVEQFSGDGVFAVFSSSDIGNKEGFVWAYSQLPKLEEFKLDRSQSLEELFINYDGAGAETFCGRLKTLELVKLPRMNRIIMHFFKALASLTLEDLNWEYLISADVLGYSLQQLEFLKISHCPNMKTVVVDAGSAISLPRLKQLSLGKLKTMTSFSSPLKEGAILHLPSLEMLKLDYCDGIEYFWSGSIVAPKLQGVFVSHCPSLHDLFIVNPEHMLELPYLREVDVMLCGGIKSIFSVPFTAPTLRRVYVGRCWSLRCFVPGNGAHNGDTQLPFLEKVTIEGVTNFSFSSAMSLVAPNLNHISYNYGEWPMLPHNFDLNSCIKYANSNKRSMHESGAYEILEEG